MWEKFNANYFMVLTVWLIQIFIPVTCQIYIFYPWLSSRDPRTFWLWVGFPFNFGVLLVYVNYVLACMTDPGSPPKSWAPKPLEASDFYFPTAKSKEKVGWLKRLLEEQSDALYTTRTRYCQTCASYKPPRTHHCSDLNRCILKMDHNCPWTNNVIGFRNYGHFMRFLVTMCVMVLYCLSLIGLRLYGIVVYDHARVSFKYTSLQLADLFVPAPTGSEVLLIIINIILLLGLCITAGILTGFQLFYVYSNITTIESLEMDKMERWINRDRFDEKLLETFPYSCGWFKNFQAVFGSNPLLWWMPQPMRGSAVEFPLNFEKSRVSLYADKSHSTMLPFSYVWPPPEFFSCKKAEKLGWSNIDQWKTAGGFAESDTDGESDLESSVSSERDFKQGNNVERRGWMPKPLISFEDGELPQKPVLKMPGIRKHVRRDSEGFVVGEVSWAKQSSLVDEMVSDSLKLDTRTARDLSAANPKSKFPNDSTGADSSGTESHSPTETSEVDVPCIPAHVIKADPWD